MPLKPGSAPIFAFFLFAALSLGPALGRATQPEGANPRGPSSCERLLTTAIDPAQLQIRIEALLDRVDGFQDVREICQRMGIRCWLFGGSAAGVAHYAKTHPLLVSAEEFGSSPPAFGQLYLTGQDVDLVIDGTAQQASQLQDALRHNRFELWEQDRTWEVRPLREPFGDKAALLGNFDFVTQHSDSASTGLLELTLPPETEPRVRDLRDWDRAKGEPCGFLADFAAGKIRYFHSENHDRTQRALQGKNPPILSVIRYLVKAFQFELEMDPRDEDRIQAIIHQFDPSAAGMDPYVRYWIEKNAKKLLLHSRDVERAWLWLEHSGFRAKLIAFGNPSTVESLSWWMNREPLRSKPLGTDDAPTAASLGLDEITHRTRSAAALESIYLARHPNAFISRSGVPGERAVQGDGFYALEGTQGDADYGNFLVRMRMHPDARMGEDFVLLSRRESTTRAILILNRNAVWMDLASFEDSNPEIQLPRILGYSGAAFDHTSLYLSREVTRKRFAKRISDLDSNALSKIKKQLAWMTSPFWVPWSNLDDSDRYALLARFAWVTDGLPSPEIQELREMSVDYLHRRIQGVNGREPYESLRHYYFAIHAHATYKWVLQVIATYGIRDARITSALRQYLEKGVTGEIWALAPVIESTPKGNPEWISSLLVASRSIESTRRQLSAWGLGTLGEEGDSRVLQALLELTWDKNSSVAFAAVRALGKLASTQDAQVIHRLETLLLDYRKQEGFFGGGLSRCAFESLLRLFMRQGALPGWHEITFQALLEYFSRAQLYSAELKRSLESLQLWAKDDPKIERALISRTKDSGLKQSRRKEAMELWKLSFPNSGQNSGQNSDPALVRN